jgi:hypothetical protein
MARMKMKLKNQEEMTGGYYEISQKWPTLVRWKMEKKFIE